MDPLGSYEVVELATLLLCGLQKIGERGNALPRKVSRLWYYKAQRERYHCPATRGDVGAVDRAVSDESTMDEKMLCEWKVRSCHNIFRLDRVSDV